MLYNGHMDTKRTLRQKLLAERLAIPDAEAASSSHAIARRLMELLDWSTVQTVHTYLPLASKGEIDTLNLIGTLQQKHPHLHFATWSDTSRSPSAIWHDDRRIVHSDHQFDVIVVPLLGYSQSGHRLGYGGGFYDRFLAKQPAAITVGLGYEMSHIPDFPKESHDIPLSYIVTEADTYVC